MKEKTKNKYTKYIKRNKLTKNIFLTGYRKDIPEILSITNLVVSLSKREGLPLNIIEAMFMKKIVLASSIRGHVDLIEHDRNGFLWDLKNRDSFNFLIKEIINNYSSYNELKNAALIKAMDYEINKINEIILRKYDQVMPNE